MKKSLSRKAIVSATLATVLVAALAGTALALANISLKLGTVASYDFGGFGPGYPVPGTIQIHAFTMHPGDSIPWHLPQGSELCDSRARLSHRTAPCRARPVRL